MDVITLILVAVSAFAATNIDDLVVLMFFFAAGKHEKRSVVTGQYLGFISIVMVSSTAYFLQFLVPSYFLSLLGIFPVAIGFKKLADLRQDANREKEDVELDDTSGYWRNVFQVASVTFTNGGDNLGVWPTLCRHVRRQYIHCDHGIHGHGGSMVYFGHFNGGKQVFTR